MDSLAILLGWPSLITALLLAAAGAWFRKPIPIWAGLVLTLPMALYVSGSPAYPFVGIFPVLALAVSALTCRGPGRWPSVGGVAVYAVFLAALAYLVLRQP